MQTIVLNAVANQELSVQLDDNLFDFQFKETNGIISVSISINTVQIIEGMRAVAGQPLIPSQYEEQGNFAIITQNFALPDYTQFGITQQLIYASAAELTTLRTIPVPPITASYFDPIAALPLRFAPQGY